MELVALLSSGGDAWPQVKALIKQGEWDKIFLIGDSNARAFTTEKEFEFVQVDLSKKLMELKKELTEKLKTKFAGLEVALSIASGTGKEHMALTSTLLSIPVGVRFTALTREGIVFM